MHPPLGRQPRPTLALAHLAAWPWPSRSPCRANPPGRSCPDCRQPRPSPPLPPHPPPSPKRPTPRARRRARSSSSRPGRATTRAPRSTWCCRPARRRGAPSWRDGCAAVLERHLDVDLDALSPAVPGQHAGRPPGRRRQGRSSARRPRRARPGVHGARPRHRGQPLGVLAPDGLANRRLVRRAARPLGPRLRSRSGCSATGRGA